MTGLLLGLLLGLGLFLVWWSCWVPPERPVRRAHRAGPLDRLSDEIVQAGFAGPVGAHACSAGGVIAFLLVLALVQATVGVLPIAVCFAAMAAYLPVAVVRSRARRRRARLRDLWPDAVDNITSGVRAGMALPEALSQLGDPRSGGAAAIRSGRSRTTTGSPAGSTTRLDRLKDRLSDPVGDRLVESLRIAREVGGTDLGHLLRTLSGFLREDARTRAELETRQSWTVNAARLAVAAPWVVLAMLSTNPESVAAYSSATGVAVLAVGGAITAVAYWVMVRIGRLPEDERVLR